MAPSLKGWSLTTCAATAFASDHRTWSRSRIERMYYGAKGLRPCKSVGCIAPPDIFTLVTICISIHGAAAGAELVSAKMIAAGRRLEGSKSVPNQFEVCLRALEQVGCGVALVSHDLVRVRFPPDPDDPHAAPDGEEREYNRTFFTLLVTRVFMELIEQGVIDEEGRGVIAAS